MQCEIRRCGSTGQREVKRPWRVRVCLQVEGHEPVYACEHCCNLLVDQARKRGRDYRRQRLDSRAIADAEQAQEAQRNPKKKRKRKTIGPGAEARARQALEKKAKEIGRRGRRKKRSF